MRNVLDTAWLLEGLFFKESSSHKGSFKMYFHFKEAEVRIICESSQSSIRGEGSLILQYI